MGWKDELVSHWIPKWDKDKAEKAEALRLQIEAEKEAARQREQAEYQAYADKISKLIMAPVDANLVGRNPMGKLGVKLDGVVFVESKYPRVYKTGAGFGVYDDEDEKEQAEWMPYTKVYIQCPHCEREFTLDPEYYPTTSENVAHLLHDYANHMTKQHGDTPA